MRCQAHFNGKWTLAVVLDRHLRCEHLMVRSKFESVQVATELGGNHNGIDVMRPSFMSRRRNEGTKSTIPNVRDIPIMNLIAKIPNNNPGFLAKAMQPLSKGIPPVTKPNRPAITNNQGEMLKGKHHELPLITTKGISQDTRGRAPNSNQNPRTIMTLGFRDSSHVPTGLKGRSRSPGNSFFFNSMLLQANHIHFGFGGSV